MEMEEKNVLPHIRSKQKVQTKDLWLLFAYWCPKQYWGKRKKTDYKHMPAIPALGRLRQKDHKFKAGLGLNTVTPCLRKYSQKNSEANFSPSCCLTKAASPQSLLGLQNYTACHPNVSRNFNSL
jgi:hypothetical protein